MIPCRICGKDAGGGWIIGFPPAPDSQKMALCKDHDLPENRCAASDAWEKFLRGRLEDLYRNESCKHGGERLLSLYFNGGGTISLPCLNFSVTRDKALKILTPGSELIFFPLAQVRSYALSPLPALKEEPDPPVES